MTRRKHHPDRRGTGGGGRRRAAPLRVPADELAAFRRRLLAWYARHGRDLPWRRTRDPYRVLVSEIMLQQTQVARVKAYYRRFLARYPTIAALAAARPAAVREAWEGLGYYARSRHLHRAARTVVSRHGGRVPRSPEDLRALAGVGPYTASAVRTFAFGEATAVLDTNAARVYQRVFGVRGDRRRARVAQRLWRIAAAAASRRRAYDFNQAIMDLGATVCVARAPRCLLCPMRRTCRGASPAGSVAGRGHRGRRQRSRLGRRRSRVHPPAMTPPAPGTPRASRGDAALRQPRPSAEDPR